jgi:hypothetical protein
VYRHAWLTPTCVALLVLTRADWTSSQVSRAALATVSGIPKRQGGWNLEAGDMKLSCGVEMKDDLGYEFPGGRNELSNQHQPTLSVRSDHHRAATPLRQQIAGYS